MRPGYRRLISMLVTALMVSSAIQMATAEAAPNGGRQSGDGLPSTQPALIGDAAGLALDLQLVAGGLTQPSDIVDPRDGCGRLFVVERHGLVRVIRDGELLAEPFLDISINVATETWEQGMLSIAFHPNYAENGEFFITYTFAPHEWRLERYRVSPDPDRADSATAELLLSIPHPGDTHYGGKMVFGSDGYLWVSVGDGGGSYDQYQNAQNLDSLMGKLLRIDVDTGDPYAIPPDNPFIDTVDARPEIWAYGLRNPWRFSFDRLTGDLYIGDVGETSWEEVNFEPADSPGGFNFGWPLTEGMQCSPINPDCDPSLYSLPIAQHDRDNGCAVTGGYIYRGDEASPLWGSYVYADYCNGTIWTAERDGDAWTAGIQLRTPFNVSAFAEDADGNLFLTDFTRGAVYRLVASAGVPSPNVIRTDPGALLAGGAVCFMSIRGWNFEPSSHVLVNDALHEAGFVDSTWLTISLAPEEIAQPGTLSIVVENDDGSRSPSHDVAIFDRGGSNGSVLDRWARDDLPVANGNVRRTWMWGSEGLTCPMSEDYQNAPDGQRFVQYFDKSRMEITDPAGDPDAGWYVTNGLLTTELISGQLQLGDRLFEQRASAEINVAGDPDDPSGPTYRTFDILRGYVALPVGATLTQRLDRDSRVWDDDAMAQHGVTAAYLDDITQHAIASPFWQYMNSSGLVYEDGQYVMAQLFDNPFYATGRPITEAYWASVKVAGTYRDVLMQCFERRCMTYTPGNEPGWEVEAGNVGQHYYRWRYGQ